MLTDRFTPRCRWVNDKCADHGWYIDDPSVTFDPHTRRHYCGTGDTHTETRSA